MPHNGMGRSYKSKSWKMTEKKKSYPLRINADVLQAMQRWSDDELRSLNAQIEYVLRESLRKTGRIPKRDESEAEDETP